jgi:ribokinase
MRTGRLAERTAELVVFGEFFLEMVFCDLADVPRFGTEVRAGRFSKTPGGGLATTALVAQSLGTRTAAITRIGNDALGEKSWNRLRESNVDTSACEIRAGAATAMTVCVAHGCERLMVTWDPINRGLEDLFERPGVWAVVRQARHVHLACSLREPRRWLGIVDRIRRAGVGVSADIGWNPQAFRAKQLPALLRRLDFVFPNEVEAHALTGASNAAQAAVALSRWVKWPVVKLGARGSLAVRDGQVLRASALPVRVVDATGSGDAFNGGFLHGYLRGWNWRDCLRAGNVCGGLATTGPGGSAAPPDARRLASLMRILSGRRARQSS